MIETARRDRVAIIGNGIAGNLAAAYFRRRLPECEVTIFGHVPRNRPVVGESTVEVTAQFLHALGLGAHLEEAQFHKYGLSHYFKERPSDASCQRYVVHEAPSVIRLPAYQLNRWTFDDNLRNANRAAGVTFVPAVVDTVDLGSQNEPHKIHLDGTRGGGGASHDARWVVDASGRNRLLARTLGISRNSSNRRDSFWFRLRDFKRSTLDRMVSVKERQPCFDSYYATHHFYGSGYWIWLIPIRSPDGAELISIGITSRDDLCPDEVRSVSDFLAVVDRDHPVIADLVRSGRTVDTNRYRNYLYEAECYYSQNGWFLLGDAAFPSDPINSAGLSTISHQIPQIAAMIEKARSGILTARYVRALDQHVAAQLALQDNWTGWYRFMEHPARMAWTVLTANALYFHFVLPAYLSGAFLDGRCARAFARRLPRVGPEGARHLRPLSPMLVRLPRGETGARLRHYIPNLYNDVVNWDLWRGCDRERPRHAARYFRLIAKLRWTLLRIVGVRPATLLSALPSCAVDFMRSLAVRIVPTALLRARSTDDLASPWGSNGQFLEFPFPTERIDDVQQPERGLNDFAARRYHADIHRTLEHEREVG